MAHSVELAKICGAFRSNRWGNSLEGEDYLNDDDSVVLSLPELLRGGRAHAEALRQKIKQDNPNLESK
jgi:hypothetical protein